LLRFAIGRFASAIGTTSVSVAVGFQLYERTHSAFALGLVGLVELIPVLVLALPAGAAADHFRRRNVAALTHVVLAACAVALMLLTQFQGPVNAYYAVLFVIGVAVAFRSPAVGSMLPQLVPAEDFSNANALISSSYELASMAGPAFAGLLIALNHGSSTWAFGMAAGSHLLFVAVLLSLPSFPPVMARDRARKLGDYFAGLRFVARVKIFLAAITLDLFAVLLGGAVALLPIFAKDILHVGPSGLGWLRAAPAIGALTMAMLQTRLPAWKQPGRVLLIAVAGFGSATIGFGLSTSFFLSFALLLITGVFDNISVVIRATLEQSLTPDVMRGRVSAIHYVFIGLSNELGSFESGATADLFGVVPSVVGGGIGTLLVVLLVRVLWPELRAVAPLASLRPLPVPPDVL
jgi:MFS family permease